MNRLSLKWRLGLIAALPFLFFSSLVLRNAAHAYFNYKDAKKAHENILLVEALSHAIHEAQIERGKAAVFLNGGSAASDLEAQFTVTDKTLKRLSSQNSESLLTETEVSDLTRDLGAFESLRKGILNKKPSTAEAIATYSRLIGDFLKSEKLIAQRVEISDIRTSLYSLAVLEEAKESGGKLRANIAATLSSDAPIDDNRFSLLVNLKGRVDGNLASPALVVSPTGENMLSQFKAMSEWQEVNSVYKLVLTQANKGHYNYDPKAFFTTITGALNFINKIILDQSHFAISMAEAAQEAASSELMLTLVFLFVSLVGLTFLSILTIKSLSTTLEGIAGSLGVGSGEVASAAQIIAGSSVQLSEATTEQAAAVQETSAAVEEISSMVSRTTEAAVLSLESSDKSQKAAIRGREAIMDMTEAMKRISSCIAEITGQAEESNKQFSEIARVISEIGDKTKVINEIVFQTKLLSFNASVEAARAGEHGKGFAVVAEEVGNLAQMSGNAAKEIADSLGESIARVEVMVKETASKMADIVARGELEVKAGNHKTEICGQSLEEILTSVMATGKLAAEISIATEEQSKGIQEVTKAMQQIDQVTQQNSGAAQEASSAATQLNTQADDLKVVISRLVSVIKGNSGSPATTDIQA